MLDVESWAEIRRLHFAEQMSIKRISRALGLARKAVRVAARSDRPPRFERQAQESAVDAFEPGIRRLSQADPRITAW